MAGRLCEDAYSTTCVMGNLQYCVIAHRQHLPLLELDQHHHDPISKYYCESIVDQKIY